MWIFYEFIQIQWVDFHLDDGLKRFWMKWIRPNQTDH